ncbi:hypothetical protein EJ02DRAFT_239479 [Clathrospora elynae]|uniref:Uncharacterized protein n=1 Tax=Clathrospora elynae TaxID=706981 RepID=A0A6A5SSS7_9PLEO|nr:hypothetical protein EJ02DRAFT_239479 [Clathrospora elynae]
MDDFMGIEKMDKVDIAFSPGLIESFPQLRPIFARVIAEYAIVASHLLMMLHALSIVEMFAPPDTNPEPAAPPIIILSQFGNVRAAPHFQEPDPADQAVQPQLSTSSACHPTSRYNLRQGKVTAGTTTRPPNKPEPEPIHATISPTSSSSTYQPTSATGLTNRTTSSTHTRAMGSKASKLKAQASNGKLQPSVKKQDREQMKEPSNYYSHRSKSMRRNTAGTGGATRGAAGGASGVA